MIKAAYGKAHQWYSSRRAALQTCPTPGTKSRLAPETHRRSIVTRGALAAPKAQAHSTQSRATEPQAQTRFQTGVNPVRCPALRISIAGRPEGEELPPRAQAPTQDFKEKPEQRRQLPASVSLIILAGKSFSTIIQKQPGFPAPPAPFPAEPRGSTSAAPEPPPPQPRTPPPPPPPPAFMNEVFL